jgi:hypothetical protein
MAFFVLLDFLTIFTIVDQFELYINLCNLQQHWLAFLALPTNTNQVELYINLHQTLLAFLVLSSKVDYSEI